MGSQGRLLSTTGTARYLANLVYNEENKTFHFWSKFEPCAGVVSIVPPVVVATDDRSTSSYRSHSLHSTEDVVSKVGGGIHLPVEGIDGHLLCCSCS